MNKETLALATQLRHELHAHPELSCKESWTKAHLISFLQTHTRLELVDRGRWFYAVHRAGTGAPAIALRADFDAVAVDEGIQLPYGSQFPGVAHKCGHDGHAAALAALALDISQTGAGRDIYFLFQHAEENGAGAAECRALLEEAPIAEIYGWHNMPGHAEGTIVVRQGTMQCASQGMVIRLTGTPAHASQPEDGKNPTLAMAEILRAIPGITRPEAYEGLVLCTVVHVNAGTPGAFGVSASTGEIAVTCRGQYEAEMERVKAALRGVAEDEAQRFGLACSFGYHDGFPETANHSASAEKVRAAARRLGLPLHELPGPLRGSEDFGHYTRITPGAYFFIGAGETAPMPHTTGYDFNDSLIETGANMLRALIEM